MDRLIDNQTGEIVAADDAWERHQRIVGLRNQIEGAFLELGKELDAFHTSRQYEVMGYETFEAYIADPDVDLSRRTATQAMSVYRHFVLKLECPSDGLLQAGISKAELLIPHTTERNVEEWLIKAAALSRSDLRLELGQAPHVSHNSGNNEWYTPPEYIEAAMRVMGGIDLDPASSVKANEVVQAQTYYTAQNDGLSQSWAGRVWMNPPYSSDLIGEFAGKLAYHVQERSVTQACVLVNNATETGWFSVLLEVAVSMCLVKGRVKFIDENGNSGAPLQGQVVLYAGPSKDRFAREFEQFGPIMQRVG